MQIAKQKEIYAYMQKLKNSNKIVSEFDEELFQSLVEYITVNTDKTLVFKFKDGSEIIRKI